MVSKRMMMFANGCGEPMCMEMDIHGNFMYQMEDSHFVYPDRNRSKDAHPYSYDLFWIWKRDNVKSKGVDVVYHDRMQEYDYDKYRKAFKLAQDCGPGDNLKSWSQDQASMFMSHYQDIPCTVIAIAEGCNKSSGHPYWVFWFKKES